jgi:methionyl-tRNA formyltransferase
MKATNNTPFVFFGTPQFAVFVLEELLREGLKPSLVVTAPDKPQGRGLLLTPSPVKVWAEKNKIPFLQPVKLDDAFVAELKTNSYELFIVAAYGKIIPKEVLDIPSHGTLNVHPSLLPKYRGASPLQSQILEGEKEIGVTIMLIDEEMDHGPIVAQQKVDVEEMPSAPKLLEILAHSGGKLLSEIIPKWIDKKIKPKEQNHEEATFTKKITKEDGLINLKNDDQYKNYLKYLALDPWPGIYFFALRREQKIRVAIKKAEFVDDKFIIKEVLPEGGKVMAFDDFLRGGVVIE